jgi:hypothetical protein
METSQQTIIITIVTSLFSAPILLWGINAISTYLNQPHILIKIIPNDIEKESAVIYAINNGYAPATKFSLLIVAPTDILYYNVFSSEAFKPQPNLTAVNPRMIQIYLDSFPPGEGSRIETWIKTKDSPHTNFRDYVAYGTFEQGSTRGTYLDPTAKLESSPDVFTSILVIAALVQAPVVGVLLAIYIRRRRIRKANKYFELDTRIDRALEAEDVKYRQKSLQTIRRQITLETVKGNLSKTDYDSLTKKISEGRPVLSKPGRALDEEHSMVGRDL